MNYTAETEYPLEVIKYKKLQRKRRNEGEILYLDFYIFYFIFIFTTSFTLSLAQKHLMRRWAMRGITKYIFMTFYGCRVRRAEDSNQRL